MTGAPTDKEAIRQQIAAIENELRRRIKAHAPARCRKSLVDFAKAMFPDPLDPDDIEKTKYETTKFHRVLASSLQKVYIGDWPRLIVSTAPRMGKTQISSKLFPAWALGNDPSMHIAVVTYSETLATEFGQEIRTFVESPAYRTIFPKLKIKARNTAASTILTTAGGSIRCVGRSGSLTGRGFHLICIDDLFRDDAEARSSTIRNNLWSWYTATLSTRLMPGKGGGIVMVGTRWHSDDVIGRLTDPSSSYYTAKEASRWRHIMLPALAEDADDPLGRNPGEPLWPERYDANWLDAQRNLDPVAFRCLYQCKPTADEGEFFKEEHILTYEPHELPDDLAVSLTCDFAISTKSSSDYSALLLIGVDASGTWWVLEDSSIVKASADQLVERIVNLCGKHGVSVCFGEKGHISKSIGPFLRERMRETQTHVPLIELQPVGDKVTRAQSLLGRLATGRILFPKRAAWFLQAKDELLRFPRGAHDDVVDALSLISFHQSYLRRGSTDKPRVEDASQALGENPFTLDAIKKSHRQRLRQEEYAGDDRRPVWLR